MDEGEYTSAHFRFWPLSAVQPVGLEVDGASGDDLVGYFGFADFLISSHDYAVTLRGEDANQIVIVGGGKPILVADSFTSFLETYLRGSAP